VPPTSTQVLFTSCHRGANDATQRSTRSTVLRVVLLHQGASKTHRHLRLACLRVGIGETGSESIGQQASHSAGWPRPRRYASQICPTHPNHLSSTALLCGQVDRLAGAHQDQARLFVVRAVSRGTEAPAAAQPISARP
jgi:hypothetical protein